jgi:AraC-like DNA-binding protein
VVDGLVALPIDSLPRVARMGVNRRREQMPFRRHLVDVFVFNHLTGANARLTIGGREFTLGADMVHLARKGDVMSGLGTDVDGGLWRWVGFTWPGARGSLELPRLTRLAGADRSAYEATFDELFQEYATDTDGRELRSAALVIRLADIVRGAAARVGERVGPGAQRAQLAAAFIERHARRRMLLREVAEAVGLNVSYLTRIFSEQYGTTPMRYLMRVRLREARRLLIEERDLPVREVCGRAGFADVGHFARAFRRRYQVSPSELRLRLLGAPRAR